MVRWVAGACPAASYFLLLAQKKVTKEERHPLPRPLQGFSALLAKAGGAPNFDAWKPGGLVSVGPFLTALVAFLILAFVVYFFIVKPYEAAKRRFSRSVEVDAAPDENTVLLREIRDALVRNDEGSPRH